MHEVKFMYIRNLTKEQEQFVRNEYQKGEMTVEEIAEKLGVDDDTLRRKAKKMGIRKARKSIWNKENESWLKSNYNLPYKELKNYLGMNDETIRLKLLEFGVTRDTIYKSGKIDMNDAEFIADVKNPTLTAPDLVRKYKDKYGFGEARIHQLRRKWGIKLQLNTIRRESSAEKAVREVLDKLDLVYFKEKPVGKYHLDFYLGQRVCIEVQGIYWHNLPKVKKSDERKKKFLEKKGYEILYIWENELENAERMILDYLKEKGFPLLRDSENKPRERKQKRCAIKRKSC
jgi:very-short-patch-repair endonuclease/Zn-dependent peptidase ImmA (M78 family)